MGQTSRAWLHALQTTAAVVVGVFAVVAVVQAATTISTNIQTDGTLSVTGLSTLLGGATTTSLTLLNGATIDNATLNQTNLAGAGESSAARLGLIRAGFNGYGSPGSYEIGGNGTYNPITISDSGNRGGAELYYGYNGTGTMRGLRLFIDNEAPVGSVTDTLSGADIEARGGTQNTGVDTVSMLRGILAEVLSKNDTITNAVGVLSDLDTGSGGFSQGSVGTWKAFDVTHQTTSGAVATGYGLYIDTIGNVSSFTDIRLHNGDTISNTAASTTVMSGAVTATGALMSNSALTKGTVNLTAGTANVTVKTGAICTVTDTATATTTKAVVAGTTLTITGSANNSTDLIAYICL
jgi:hypothetical protein